jgi:hypothetical protein
MKSIISRCVLLCVLAVACGSSFADDLSSALQSQANITGKNQLADEQKKQSYALRQEALNIEKDAFLAFYQGAAKAGIQFDIVSLPPKSESAGVVTFNETLESFDNGRFVVNKRCDLSCDVSPVVNIGGLGEMYLSMIFDGPNKEASGCEGWSGAEPSLSCTCRFSAFSVVGDLSMPCSRVFDRNQRELVTKEIVAWLNKSLVADLKNQERTQ